MKKFVLAAFIAVLSAFAAAIPVLAAQTVVPATRLAGSRVIDLYGVRVMERVAPGNFNYGGFDFFEVNLNVSVGEVLPDARELYENIAVEGWPTGSSAVLIYDPINGSGDVYILLMQQTVEPKRPYYRFTCNFLVDAADGSWRGQTNGEHYTDGYYTENGNYGGWCWSPNAVRG